MQQKEKQNSQP